MHWYCTVLKSERWEGNSQKLTVGLVVFFFRVGVYGGIVRNPIPKLLK